MYQSITPNLMVENVEETVKFYVEKLGFTIITSVPDKSNKLVFAILGRNEAIIMFQLKENLVEEYPILDTATIKPSLSLYIKVDDIDNLYESLIQKVTIIKEMHLTFYNTKEFAIIDINNNVLTIAE